MRPQHDPPPADLHFRPLTRADFPRLLDWLTTPHVAEWWLPVPAGLAELEAHYGPTIDRTDPTEMFVIEVDHEPIGLIQRYLHVDDPEWDRAVDVPLAAGIDYLIGPVEYCGRGLGSAAIRAFAATVFDRYPAIRTVVAVPQKENPASCRALEKAGFTAVREGELDTDDPSDAGISVIYVLARAD
jgi:RimJ/RimL family protein N-acetyltransferase